MHLRKDKSLDLLAERFNVAQFVSFSPSKGGLEQEFSRVLGFTPNFQFNSVEHAVSSLLATSPERSVNVRSYTPDSPRSREFVYGIRETDTAVETLYRLAREGLFVIANETVDVSDGGVSGVAQGDVLEFAPDDTPRCVEKPGVASLPRELGIAILRKVYGFDPDLPDTRGSRVEFSLHPKPRGWKATHTLTWEYEELNTVAPNAALHWPNRFSRHLGDKVYGLLVADALGLPVPETIVIGRRVAPFKFGMPTGSCEIWTRTAPIEPQPGFYTTTKGWLDPFKLFATEDPTSSKLISVLSQAAVPARYSGAAIVMADGDLWVEGHSGEGDALMLGKALPEPMPSEVERDVRVLHKQLQDRIGPVRFEWVHDGTKPWVVQLHFGQTQTLPEIIFPGEPDRWTIFEAVDGIDALRTLLNRLPADTGLTVVGEIGLTSHLADLVRKAKRPTRVVKQLSFAFS